MPTLIVADKETCYVASAASDAHQRIYEITGNLVMPARVSQRSLASLELLAQEHRDSWFRKRLSPDMLADKARLRHDLGDVVVAGYQKGVRLCRTQAGQVREAAAESREPRIVVTLGNPLEELADFCRAHRDETVQFGIHGKAGARVLYAPETRFLAALPDHYRDGARLSAYKQEVNAQHHRRLLAALLAKDLARATAVIEAYRDEDYCLLDRLAHGIVEKTKTLLGFSVTKRSPAEEEQRDILASSRQHQGIIVAVRHDGTQAYARRQEAADALRKQYGIPCTALMTTPRIVVRADPAEASVLASRMRDTQGKAGVLGARVAKTRVLRLPKPKRYCRMTQSTLAHVELLNAYSAHRVTRGAGVIGAVMDSGVDYAHEALVQNFDDDKGHDFVRDTKDPMDREGHGTHVAGIWAAVAPEVTLKAVRVLDEYGRGSEADILLGYEWCYRRNIPIINCSFGSWFATEEEREVVEAAADYGCSIVAAAGNDGETGNDPDIANYPAAFAGVLGIASVDRDRQHSPFSNMGFASFAAMGEDVLSTLPGNAYGVMDGTSMASPSVAGALTLQLSAHPSSEHGDLLMIAKARCQKGYGLDLSPEEWKRRYGYGIPDCTAWVR